MANPHSSLAARNNNPLNMRPLPNGERWQGQTGVDRNPVTGAFCVFENNVFGIRAAVINQRSYIRTGSRTLRDIIYRWAPPPKNYVPAADGSAVGGVDQNNSEAYVRAVAKAAGVSPEYDMRFLSSQDPTVPVAHRYVYQRILAAMNAHEAGGRTADDREIEEGIALALHIPKGYVRTDDGNVIREDVKDSSVVKAADQGVQGTAAIAIVGTAAPAVAAFAGMPWESVAVICGAFLIALAGFAIYKLLQARKGRVKMHNEGIA